MSSNKGRDHPYGMFIDISIQLDLFSCASLKMIMIEIINQPNVVCIRMGVKNDRRIEMVVLARTSRIDEVSSDYSQRRSNSVTGILEEKSSRNDLINSDSYYVVPKPSSDAGSDTKKRSRSYVRPIIRSAVPN